MQKVSPRYRLLILSISSPLTVGVYSDDDLIETIKSDKKSSEILIHIIADLMEQYPLSSILYINGPGSFMAVKLTYIILRSIEITRGVPFYGCSAFEFNDARPIKAMGNLYFIKENETIVTKKLEEPISQEFRLPEVLTYVVTQKSATPNYLLPAV